MTRVVWIDCSAGVSGDMLLGALHETGALPDLEALRRSLKELDVEVIVDRTTRAGLAATAVTITAPDEQPHRRITEVHAVIGRAGVPDEVKARALAVFDRLARAEAAVHGTSVDEVEFHEVGAVDSIIDVLGACLGLHALNADRIVVSTISLGGGTVDTAHGDLPVPTPAALALLERSKLAGVGGGDVELATPTGIAVLAEWATESGPMPVMEVVSVGTGAGARDLPDRPNVVRLVVGDAVESAPADQWFVIETNVDDMDPRVWPNVIAKLLEVGAADAWLTPVLMKKGRPAHVLSALTSKEEVGAVERAIFAETSTIGLRRRPVDKVALERRTVTIDLKEGFSIRVKLAFADGVADNASPEYEDIVTAANALGVPVKDMLEAASTAIRTVFESQAAAEE